MSENPSPDVRAVRRDSRRHGRPPARSAHVEGGIRIRHLWISVLPATVMALLGAATVTCLLAADPSDGTTRLVLAAALAGCAVILFAAVRGAGAATHWVHRRLGALRSSSARSQEDLQRLVEQVQNGERPAQRSPEAPPVEGSDAFALLAHDRSARRHCARGRGRRRTGPTAR